MQPLPLTAGWPITNNDQRNFTTEGHREKAVERCFEPRTAVATSFDADFMARPAAATNWFLNYQTRENARKSKAEARAF
jgi:hypothetical protein